MPRLYSSRPSLVFNDAAIQFLLQSPAGPVIRDLSRRALRVESAAKRLCPVDHGRLRSSIHWRLGRDARGYYADVGTNVSYALPVEFGTRPHIIRPVNKRALFWKGARHPVAYVNHPGTRARPFLRPALAAARR